LRLDDTVRDPMALHIAKLERVRRLANRFDVLHFHLDYLPFSVFSRQATPFITTMHGRLDLPEHQTVFNAFGSVPVISISDMQRKPVPQARWMKTIYHGLPADLLAPGHAKPGYLAFLGRIAPEKSVDRAIRIAVEAGLPLKIAAKVDRVDRDYFERDIRPMLDLPGIEYIGEIDDAQKSAFLGGAMALLMPIDWPEPFGLVMIEAMACGTPVIAFRSGSVPEVVEHGVTGLIVESEAAAVAAIRNELAQLSRPRIRARFEERFTARRMAEEYLAIYRGLIAGNRRRRPKAVNGANTADQHIDDRHQTGMDGGLYVAD
jgi:glycosyltransferase involved in cell wall biosynthesis